MTVSGPKIIARACLFLGLATAGMAAHADRDVLAPSGLILPPGVIKLEGMASTRDFATNREWLNIGMPQQIIGLELEAERFITHGYQRNGLSAQYSFTGNAFTDLAPAISVGVKDLLRTGLESQAAYIVMTKAIPLSERQEKLVRDFKLTVGYGSSTLGGPYAGFQTKLVNGCQLNAEFVAKQLNASFAIPVCQHWQAKVSSIRRDVFYGIGFTLSK